MNRPVFLAAMVFWLVSPIWFGSKAFGQIEVVESEELSQIEALIENFFVGGGVEVFNIEFEGLFNQFATFDNKGSHLGIREGLVMVTGYSEIIRTNDHFASQGTVNVNDAATSASSGGGDSDLSQIVGAPTFDAVSIEFDFIPHFDFLRFRYIFASEEYPEYNCTEFNDVFAFLLSGPNYPVPFNIATIPGTDMAVAINSINDGTFIPGRGQAANCQPPRGSSNTDLYVDNIGGSHLEFDGLTHLLKATASVIPCETYHIKLAIADVSDTNLDSGVFFDALSFESIPFFSITADNASEGNTAVEGCNEVSFVVSVQEVATTDLEFDLQILGTALPGIDFLPISTPVVIPTGQQSTTFSISPIHDQVVEPPESVQIVYDLPSCDGLEDTLQVYITDDGILSVDPPEGFFCEGNERKIQLTATAGNSVGGTFHWSPTMGLSDPSVANPVATLDTPIIYTVVYEKEHCRDTATWEASAAEGFSILGILQEEACEGQPLVVKAEVTEDTSDLHFQWLPAEAFECNNCPQAKLIEPFNRIDVVVSTANGCIDSVAFDIQRRPVLNKPLPFCADASFGTVSFGWDPVPPASRYRVEVGNTVFATAGDETFATIQLPNDFNDAEIQISIKAIDHTGSYCASEAAVLECPLIDCRKSEFCNIFVPNVFSPNQDGRNDHFYVQANPSVEMIKSLKIFGRYGTLIFEINEFAPNDVSFGWDGQQKGQFVNAGVFVWVVEALFKDGTVRQFKGDVTVLK